MAAGMGPLRSTRGLGTVGEDDTASSTAQQVRVYGLAALGILVIVGAVVALVWLF